MMKLHVVLLLALIVAGSEAVGLFSNLRKLVQPSANKQPELTPEELEEARELQEFQDFLKVQKLAADHQQEEEHQYQPELPATPQASVSQAAPVPESSSRAPPEVPASSSPFGGTASQQPAQQPAESLALPWSGEVKKERRPLDEKELTLALKALFVWSAVLPAEDVLDKLQAIDPNYERIKTKLPIDSRKLVSFSQEIEEHCNDADFYASMISTQKLANKEYPALKDYMMECMTSYQDSCDVESGIVEGWNKFKADHKEGWTLIDEVRVGIEKNRKRGLFLEENLGMVALHDCIGSQGEPRKVAHLLRDSCEALGKLASSLRTDALDASLTTDSDVKLFLDSVKVCRKLDDENYLGHLEFESQG